MCGRATDTKNTLPSGLQFTLPALRDFHPRYNVAPTQPIRILRIVGGQPEQRYARWGLVPAFAKAELGAFPVWKFPTFNARSEELESKPSFRHTLAGQRCLVLIDGFYEWTGTTGSKVAHYIYLPSHATFAIAGLWDHWRSKDGKREFTSCTMLTQGAGTFMRALHTREPVILPVDRYEAWLDQADPHWRPILGGMGPALEQYAVDGYLNHRGAEGPACIAPLHA